MNWKQRIYVSFLTVLGILLFAGMISFTEEIAFLETLLVVVVGLGIVGLLVFVLASLSVVYERLR